MNTVAIIEKGLKDMGADGLVNGDLECGCPISDLCPCGELDIHACQPAILKVEGGEDVFYAMEAA